MNLWKKRRRPLPDAVPVAPEMETVTELVATANTVEVASAPPEQLAALDEFAELNHAMNRVVQMRELIEEMYNQLREHVTNVHTDTWECDPWCGPQLIATYLRQASQQQLHEFTAVLLKDSFWAWHWSTLPST